MDTRKVQSCRVLCKILPQVYHPKEKPGITPEGVSVDELKAQIKKCPSGALGYRITGNTK